MTTGPEHYAEAEKCLSRLPDLTYGSDEAREQLAAAQVHATLALAAATALRIEYPEYTRGDDSGWAAAAGGGPKRDEADA